MLQNVKRNAHDDGTVVGSRSLADVHNADEASSEGVAGRL